MAESKPIIRWLPAEKRRVVSIVDKFNIETPSKQLVILTNVFSCLPMETMKKLSFCFGCYRLLRERRAVFSCNFD